MVTAWPPINFLDDPWLSGQWSEGHQHGASANGRSTIASNWRTSSPESRPNALIECFNRTYRTEVLDRYVFTSPAEVRRTTEDWRHRYNHHRPYRSLAGLSPAAFARAQSPSTSTSD